jgi:hypothetical protein
MAEHEDELWSVVERFQREREEERRASREEFARRQESASQDLADRIEAGLVNADALKKYLDIRRRRAEEMTPAELPEPSFEVIRLAGTQFIKAVAADRWSTMATLSSLNALMLSKPDHWWGNGSGLRHSADPRLESSAKASGGGWADVKAFALGTTDPETGKEFPDEGSAEVWFAFVVPAAKLPTGGSRLKVRSTWNLWGVYSLIADPGPQSLFGSLSRAAYAHLMARTVVCHAWGAGVVGTKTIFVKEVGLAGPTADWKQELKYPAVEGPVVEYDAPGGNNLYVFAGLYLRCGAEAKGQIAGLISPYAELNFDSSSVGAFGDPNYPGPAGWHSEIERVLISW